ncbi:AAA-like domain-containing protein [Vibrio amylolyticus]|uniref:AAA-like domain-containing protein n=1 Tax=Vibrio amylolyticus TaxID=2847292 RepID=UPI003550D48F
MNHQEAKDILQKKLPEASLSLIKIEVFRLSWLGKGYNVIAEETGYDHDYVRKAGSDLWKELSQAMNCAISKRNVRNLLEEQLIEEGNIDKQLPDYPGGPLSFSSPFYIERTQEEAQVYQEICRPGGLVRIRGPRKMGKSSLMLRVLDQGESEGYQKVIIDFHLADRSILTDLEKLLRWVCLQMTSQLGLESKIDDYWNELIGSKLSCTTYLQQYILEKTEFPTILVFNELNLLFDQDDVSRDFLPLLRSWHEESKHNDSMKKLRQLLIYSTEVYVQLDINLSPFNVGLPIELSALNGEQLTALSNAYGFNFSNDNNVNSPTTLLLNKLGGHPYLVQLALYQLATKPGFIESPSSELKSLIAHATESNGLFSDFLQHLIADMTGDKSTEAFRKLIANEPLARPELYILDHLGLIEIVDDKPKITSQLLINFLRDNL